MCELDPDYSYTYDIDINFEIFNFCQLIRRSGYLADSHESTKHTTLQGKVLEESVINFDKMCNQNKSEFLEFLHNTQIAGTKEISYSLKTKTIFIP